MMILKVAVAATLAVVFGFTGASAQTLRNADEPAEFPPSSFTGKQYVDSRGCVYIRAGIDRNVTWVPRVSRSRQVVCGFQPTLAGVAPAAPVAKPSTAAKPQEIIIVATPKPTPKPVVRAPKPTPVMAAVVRRPAPVLRAAPKPVVRRAVPTPKPIVRVAVPAPVVRRIATITTPTTKPVSKPIVRRAGIAAPATRQASSCRGASAVSQQYTGRSTSELPVRCGPQTRTVFAPAVVARPAPIAIATTPAPKPAIPVRRVVRVPAKPIQAAVVVPRLSASTRIVPRHVYETQLTTNAPIKIPKGYRQAWSDDRLNTRRAQQTVRGLVQMNLVWTQQVPRRLIDVNTNKDVTGKFPKLVYPYIDMDAQLRYRGTDSTVGQTTRRAVLKSSTTRRVVRASTKSASGKPVARAASQSATLASGHKYVQVGLFGVIANAENTAARLRSLGFPVRYGSLKRGGKSYRVVLAGPFSNAAQQSSALRKARNAGYKDAFLR